MKKLMIAALAATTALTGVMSASVASAQPGYYRHDRDWNGDRDRDRDGVPDRVERWQRRDWDRDRDRWVHHGYRTYGGHYGYNGYRGNAVIQLTSQSRRHKTAVGHARNVDPVCIGMVGIDDIGDQLIDKFHVVDILIMRGSTAAVVPAAVYALRANDDHFVAVAYGFKVCELHLSFRCAQAAM